MDCSMINKGCTAKHRFPFDSTKFDLAALYVTYQQNGHTVLEKTIDDVELEPDAIVVAISQNDSLKFDSRRGLVRIQIRIKTVDGYTSKSNVMTASVDELLKDGEI